MTLFGLSLAACPPSYPDCDNDGHCESHSEVCVDGHCRQCRDDSQCTSLDVCMTCQANECVRRPNCCKSDVDCPEGRCKNNTCTPECTLNSDCPDGERCKNGRCAVDTGCTSDSQCPNGLKCRNGECTTACELQVVYFDFDEFAIRLDQEKVVHNNADCLKSATLTSVLVEGHTDERGSDEYNLTLGERRAQSVANQYNLLGVKGVGRVVSYGEEKPACAAENESCWRQNRRAETKVR
jgi:peptidoglycan-associated lipoprotein